MPPRGGASKAGGYLPLCASDSDEDPSRTGTEADDEEDEEEQDCDCWPCLGNEVRQLSRGLSRSSGEGASRPLDDRHGAGESETRASVNVKGCWMFKQFDEQEFDEQDKLLIDKDMHLVDPSLHVAADIYDCVSIAAYGGLAMSLGTTSEKEKSTQRIHPAFIWLFAMVLFLIQARFILAVILEVDQIKFLSSFDLAGVHIWQFDIETKLALIVIVQIMVNSELTNALQMFVFMLNPYTWIDRLLPKYIAFPKVNGDGSAETGAVTTASPQTTAAAATANDAATRGGRAGRRGRGGGAGGEASGRPFRPVFVYFFAVTAAFAKFVISFYVSVSSISIIFRSGSLTEAIFNCLALTFIKDLDEDVWKVLSSNLRLKVSDHKEYFVERKKWKVDGAKPESEPAEEKECRSEEDFVFFMIQPFKHGKHSGCPWDELWKMYPRKRNCRLAFVSLMLLYAYSSQLFMSIDVLHTGWLPSSRQVCWLWRVLEGQKQDTLFSQLARPVVCWWLNSVRDRLSQVADPAKGGYCTGVPEEQFLSFWEQFELWQKYPASVTSGLLTIVALLVLPPSIMIFLEEWQKRAQKKQEEQKDLQGSTK